MITSTFLVPDIPRAFTALAQWLSCMMVMLPLQKRKAKPVLQSLAFLLVQCLYMVLTDNLPVVLWIPCMMGAFGIMLAAILSLCDVSFFTAAYSCIRAFIMAEFAASLEWQLHFFLWSGETVSVLPAMIHGISWTFFLKRYGLLLAVYGAVFLIIFLVERQLYPRDRLVHATGREVLTASFFGIFTFTISNLSFVFSRTPFSGQNTGEIFNIRTLSDLGGLAALYAYHAICTADQARNELGTMESILENQYAQYKMSRDSIDMINRKYHDLKHQIAALRAEPDPEVRAKWLDEMESDICAYEAQNKTGNSILDTVLTGKSLYCQKHNIGLTAVADGKHLGFMDVMDICSIFGNALDNAIECELKIPEKGKRMIHLTLAARKQFLVLQVENYCPDPPRFQDGLPTTTKSDGANHGFGVKSIRFAAAKYGGTTTIRAENGWFILKILIPLPEDSQE